MNRGNSFLLFRKLYKFPKGLENRSKLSLEAIFLVWIVVFGFVLMRSQSSAFASVLINELLADPPIGISGDANGDGVGSSTQDEFLELLNFGSTSMDLSGWYLNDAVKTRHVFPSGTELLAYQYLVVFGGGMPSLPEVNVQVASSGGLSLNNTAEDVFLYNNNGQLMDYVSYGAQGGKDQALVRDPEGSGLGFVLHSTVPGAQGKIFSPGRSVDGRLSLAPGAVATPEVPGIMSLGSGVMAILMGFYRQKMMC